MSELEHDTDDEVQPPAAPPARGEPAGPQDAPSAVPPAPGPPGPWTVWAPPYGPTPAGSPPPPPLPPWGPPPAPWGSGWEASGWGTPPAAPPRRSGSAMVALTLVAALVAGMAGVAVGNRLARTTSTTPTAAGVVVPTPDRSVSGVVEKVIRSVVDINTRLSYQGAQAAGTGLVLTTTGDILTNNHVIDGSTAISVTVVDTGRTYAAKVVGTDPTADVAVIRLDHASGLHAIDTTPPRAVTPGDAVLAIGNAGGQGGTPSVVSGTVSATNQAITASDENGSNAERLTGLIETNAPIEPGDSGGPLVNSSGDVIGVNTAASSHNRFDSSTAIGFAIPLSQALGVARQIESGTASSAVHLGLPAFLGVSIDTSQGTALVNGVEAASPAAGLGLQSGDTITTVDGKPVGPPQNLTTLLRVHRPGERATIGWIDTTGARHTGSAVLVPGPAD